MHRPSFFTPRWWSVRFWGRYPQKMNRVIPTSLEVNSYGNCMLQEVRVFHKRYFSFRVKNQNFMELEQTKSKWSVIEPLAVTVSKTSSDHRMDIPRKRYSPQGFDRWKENRTSRYTHKIGGRRFHPGRIQARGRKEKGYKKWWFAQKRGLELKS